MAARAIRENFILKMKEQIGLCKEWMEGPAQRKKLTELELKERECSE
jgi:hypothetical protein